jgi:hypothetical protein
MLAPRRHRRCILSPINWNSFSIQQFTWVLPTSSGVFPYIGAKLILPETCKIPVFTLHTGFHHVVLFELWVKARCWRTEHGSPSSFSLEGTRSATGAKIYFPGTIVQQPRPNWWTVPWLSVFDPWPAHNHVVPPLENCSKCLWCTMLHSILGSVGVCGNDVIYRPLWNCACWSLLYLRVIKWNFKLFSF